MTAPTRSLAAIGLGAFLLLGGGLTLYNVVPAALSDFASLKARSDIERLRGGQMRMPPLPEWARLRQALSDAVAKSPDSAQLRDELAYLYAVRAQSMKNVPELLELRQQLLVEAAGYYRQAAALRPMFPYGWANLALAKHYADQVDDELWSAFDKAMAYGRREPNVQLMLAEIAFARWSTLDTARAAAVTAMVAETPEDLRAPLLDLARQFVVPLDTAGQR
jgi:hypothetical protein